MASMELDPLFLKALTLLRSKSRESTDQLKALLDEVLGKKSKADSEKDELESGSRMSIKKDDGDKKPVSTMNRKLTTEDKRSVTKRPLDKPISQAKPDTIPSKKAKVDAPKKVSTIRRPVIDDDDDDESDDDAVFEPDKPSEVINISSDSDELSGRGGSKVREGTGQSGEETTMDDFALELGLACVVCMKMDVSAKNQLIECQECHNLYHQFCHKPPATDADASDPRLVWYCAKCQRNMRKSVDKKPTKSVSSPTDLSPMGEKKSGEQTMNLFKRSEPKTPPVSSVGKSQPFTGLANFAANVSGRGPSSMKSSSIPSKPSTILGKNNIKVNMSAGPPKSGSLSSSRTIVSKFISSSSGSRSPSPQPSAGQSKGKSGSVKTLPQASQASAMRRLQQMKRKASKR